VKTPYEVLGVPRDSSTETIKKAWRKKAAKSHPDKGGSGGDMASLNWAYALLSNEKARAYYDATGLEQNLREESELAEALARLIDMLIDQIENVAFTDVVESAKEAVRRTMTVTALQRTAVEQAIKKKREAYSRVVDPREGPSNVSGVLASMLSRMEAQVSSFNADMQRGERMLEALAMMSYRVDERPQEPAYPRTSGTSGAWATVSMRK